MPPRSFWTGLIVVFSVPVVFAQSSVPLEFDVASIKRNIGGPSAIRSIPGEFVATHVAAMFLVMSAYPTLTGQAEAMPSWVGTEYYDVAVKFPVGASREQQQQMWRTLLADRMELAAHYEPREVPSYDLVLARSDGHLGPQLKASALDCESQRKRDEAPLSSSQPVGPVTREQILARCNGAMNSGNEIYAGGISMGFLAAMLRGPSGRVVVDRTGLRGMYALTLRFSRGPAEVTTNAPADDGPSVFTAVEEQLGLKLVPSKAQVQVLVIDHIERPTEI